ncbi:MAG: ATPase [Eubacteriaceae bacterium]|nr:ATPase [Eubacteriaceae bacterium]
MSETRHYFPGNNTPEGFFSYYDYIINQREANKKICIKGGPGTGKSTFMKTVAHRLESIGKSIDYLHCSADPNSIDGIIIKEDSIAIVDGTSPHVIDPVTPGAVDNIINFGDFWVAEGFDDIKNEIINGSEECSHWYALAYNYLSAAKCIYKSLEKINDDCMEISEVYKIASDIIEREYRRYDISYRSGKTKKFFATAITCEGTISYVKTLLHNLEKIYLINVPEGYSNSSFMSIIKEGAVYRGFDAECFYCPMNPENKIEHIVIPELSLAFVTTNKWHDIEAWELDSPNIILIDLCDCRNGLKVEKNKGTVQQLSKIYSFLIGESIKTLKRAKEIHDIIESQYIPNMNFKKIDELVEKVIADITKEMYNGCDC